MFKTLLFVMIGLLATSSLKAQTTPDEFFYGKWDVLVKGTPNGDPVIPVVIEMKDGKLSGSVANPESKEITAMTSVEIKEGVLTASFSMIGYDLTLVLTKKDDDHAVGKLMDMFDAEATRKKD